MLKENRKNPLKEVLPWILPVIIYMLIFSASTSPLFPDWYMYDSAVFLHVGSSILKGQRLYADIFDHKGPFIHWLNSLGLILGGRTGVFALQCLFLLSDLLIIKKIAGLFTCKKRDQLLITALTFMILSFPLSNGNLTEEYSLPFIFLSLYFFTGDILNDKSPKPLHSFFYGISTAFMFFLRLNNAVSIYGIIICWIVILIKKGQWDILIKNLISGILGILLVTIPVLIIFMLQGTLYEMWYGVFLFNMMYSSGLTYIRNFTDPKTFAHILINFTPVIISMLVVFKKCELPELKWSFEFISILNILSLFLGQGYNHYFMVYVPLCTLMLIVEASSRRDKLTHSITALMCLLYLLLFVRIIAVNIGDYYISGSVLHENEAVKEDLSVIPEDEKNSVLGYGIPSGYYELSGIPQCYRFAIAYPMWSGIDEDIRKDFEEYMSLTPPKWIVMAKSAGHGADIYLSDYEGIRENEYFILYKRDN